MYQLQNVNAGSEGGNFIDLTEVDNSLFERVVTGVEDEDTLKKIAKAKEDPNHVALFERLENMISTPSLCEVGLKFLFDC
jgi:hypothetical protein